MLAVLERVHHHVRTELDRSRHVHQRIDLGERVRSVQSSVTAARSASHGVVELLRRLDRHRLEPA